jgi:hypothetical protein
MSSPEIFERMGSPKLPFSEIELGGLEKHHLEVLHLNSKSTADEVRRVAITAQAKMREDCVGLNGDLQRGLFWALGRTNDCINEQEFFRFLLRDSTFEEIERDREIQFPL